jgi:hypothetical protein
MEGALWQGRFIHIPLSIRAKTPYPSPQQEKTPPKYFFIV